ncbi:amidohydrolase family protein [Streptomyces sp. NPDC014894]|uniref:amidohydrolase family protein n=1 Tax=unclassified Streptomyces TaxID=2593676 RepID=UPI0036F8FC73
MTRPTGLIDVHHHAIPPLYARAIGARFALPGSDRPGWSPRESLEVMDAQGIATSVLSVPPPGVTFVEGGASRALARQVNEYFAALVAEHPTRFGAFAVLPLPDVGAAMEELDHVADVLRLDGVGLLTCYGHRYLGDPEFEPLLAEIADRGLPVHVHPGPPPAQGPGARDLPPAPYDLAFETTRTVVSLLFNGVLDRLPHLKLIVSHAGGTLPFLAKRLTYGPELGKRLTYGPELGEHHAERAPVDVIAQLRGLYFDIAGSANDDALPALTRLAAPERILFGSDFPFTPADRTAENVAGFASYREWTDERRAAVGRDNALALLPRLAAR